MTTHSKPAQDKTAAKLADIRAAIRAHRTAIKVAIERDAWTSVKNHSRSILRLASDAQDLLA
jgi:hypothetical protein